MRTYEIQLYGGDLNISVYQDSLKDAVKRADFYYTDEMDSYTEMAFHTKKDKQYYIFIHVHSDHGEVAAIARRMCSQIYEVERITISAEQVIQESRLIEWIVNKIHVVLNGTKIKKAYIECKGNTLAN